MSTDALVERLGWTLLHSMWQLGLIAVMFAAAYRLLARRSPQARYLLCGLTLLAMLAGPGATFAWLAATTGETPVVGYIEPPRPALKQHRDTANTMPVVADIHRIDHRFESAVPPNSESTTQLHQDNDTRSRDVFPQEAATSAAPLAWFEWLPAARQLAEPWLPALVGLWLSGVVLLSCRHLGGWIVVERLRRRATFPAAMHLTEAADRLSRRLGLRRTVRLLESAAVQVPSVVGWLRPVILLPFGLASGLPADQLEAILLHELAHIRRRDYLANLLQTAAETLLFYHPAVWWVSGRMRLEREYCADQLAASACGDRVLYAKALAELESHCAKRPGLAVAADGGDLRRRIERILGLRGEQPARSAYWLAGTIASCLIMATLTAALWGNRNAGAQEQPDSPAERISQSAEPAPSTAESTIAENTASTPDDSEQPAGPMSLWEAAIVPFLMWTQTSFENAHAPPPPHQFLVRVVTTQGKPVAGAVVTPRAVGTSDGSSSGTANFEELVPPGETNAEGLFEIDLSGLYDSPLGTYLKGRGRRIDSVIARVEHPDHPPWDHYIWIGNHTDPYRPTDANADRVPESKVILSDSRTVEIRARRGNEPGLLTNLYPMMPVMTGRPPADWSQTGGVLTIRRVDLTTERQPDRWLRVVHVPDDGPLLFSELIDLKQHEEEPISIDVSLKPGVRVAGRLSEQVPRPVKNGRVAAFVAAGPDTYNSWTWGVVAEIAADGSFELDSLPPDENLQVVAVCDGWASVSLTPAELRAYTARHEFPMRGDHETAYHFAQPGLVYPRLHRLSGPRTEIVVPMEQTVACEVTVVDDQDRPIPDAEVQFYAMQNWFNAWSHWFGVGVNSPAAVRKKLGLDLGDSPPDWLGENQYVVTTNAEGVAVVPNLPCGPRRTADALIFRFAVSHEEYVGRNGHVSPLGPLVKLTRGETARTTVRLQRLP